MTWATMTAKFRSVDGPDAQTRILIPCRDLDNASLRELRHRIEDSLAEGRDRVILDLADVDFMDTAAIAALLDASMSVRRAGGVLRVVSPPDSRTTVVFQVTRADALLRLADSREEALRAA